MVSEGKKELVQKLVKQIREYPIVGLVNMENLPAAQLQKMKAKLAREKVALAMARKKLLQRAMEESQKKNIGQLAQKIKGMPALIFSWDNPFTIYSLLRKNKSEAPAKPGQRAPRDITVKAGPTNFAPGPIISELAAVGIKTKVEAGKLAIMADTIVVKEGEVISPKVAETLKRLDIRPMEIGLDLVAIWEDGLVFEARQLHLDEAEFGQKIVEAVQWARNLALEAAYPTVETIEPLLQKAFGEAKALSLEGEILTDLTAGEILAKVAGQAWAVKEAGGIEVSDRPVPKRKEGASEGRKEGTGEDRKEEGLQEEAEQPGGEPHPKQGRVTLEEASHLLEKLRKKGTLRE